MGIILQQTVRPALRSAAFFLSMLVGGWVVWKILGLGLASNRGIDLTDEGLYLLSADPPQPFGAWGFPFGWHTRPLFAVAGYDIANFRTLGAMILLLAGAWAGHQVATLTYSWRPKESKRLPNFRPKRAFEIIGAFLGGVGSLMYYAGLVRTPSYNWLALLGMLIACGGYCSAARRLQDSPLHLPFIPLAVIASGLFISLPGKANVAPMTLFLGGVLLVSYVGLRRGLSLTLVVALLTVFFIATAWLLGLWAPFFPKYFLSVFDTAMPRLVPSHGVAGAVVSAAMVPWVFVRSLVGSPSSNAAWIGCLLVMAVCRGASFKHSPMFRYFFPILVGLTALACAWTARIPQSLTLGSAAAFRFTFTPSVTAAILATVLVLGLSTYDKTCLQTRSFKATVFYFALMFYPVVFSFGTSTSPYAQSSMAIVFILLAGFPATMRMSLPHAVGALSALLGFTILLLTATLKDSWKRPYRIPPIIEHTKTVGLGRNQHSLLIDSKTANALLKLRDDALSCGWRAGTPLIETVWSWAPTASYFLSAKVPKSLLITLFGYPNSIALAKYVSDKYLDDFPTDEAWVLTGDTQRLSGSEGDLPRSALEKEFREESQRQLLDHIFKNGKNRFPEDYTMVSNGEYFTLWKPR